MKAELRRLHSPDVDDLTTFAAEDPGCFALYVQAMIGPQGEAGEESFGFMVCSPSWISREVLHGGHHWTGAALVLERYDYAVLQGATMTLCANVEGKDWTEVAAILAAKTDWEFAQYRE